VSSPDRPARRRWAQLRFSIIGPLLAAPPEHGDLRAALEELAAKRYKHPTTGEAVRFGVSTIERWLYCARGTADPVAALARKVPSHAGSFPAMPARLAAALEVQWQQHPGWTMQLHADNLRALVREDPWLGPMPSYTTVCRFMKDRGWLRHRKKKVRDGAVARTPRETRSFEVSHVHGLWHLDFHVGSRKALTRGGEWRSAVCLAILDDCSRLCCHLQWYLDETAETLVHGFSQACAKRGLPRAALSDNGAAMLSAEFTEGLDRLGILHHTTLPYSPEQNAKQEVFWAQLEGRLVAMLEGEPELTLQLLNDATQAWVELEYQRRRHDELGTTPLERALAGPTVVRPCPSSDDLRRAFRTETTRAVRRSDATFTVAGVRFELPWQYRTLRRVTLRVARWDLSSVDLCDPRTAAYVTTVLPLDKTKNADRQRRIASPTRPGAPLPPTSGIAPHLRQLMADYAATGFPPAYVPKEESAAELADLDHPTGEVEPMDDFQPDERVANLDREEDPR
jgi:transposase InsO family protein